MSRPARRLPSLRRRPRALAGGRKARPAGRSRKLRVGTSICGPSTRPFAPRCSPTSAAFRPTLRRVRSRGGRTGQGIDPSLISASTVVVSALLGVGVFNGDRTDPGWVSVTLRVPSGAPVAVSELFADPSLGLRVFGNAWRARLSRGERACVAPDYVGTYAPGRRLFPAIRSDIRRARCRRRAVRGLRRGFVATVPYRHPAPVPEQARRPVGGGRQRAANSRRRVKCEGALRSSRFRFCRVAASSRQGRRTRRPFGGEGPIGFKVTVAAEGARRSRTGVRLTLRGANSTIVRSGTIESIAPEGEKSVLFSDVGVPAFDDETALKLDVAPLRSSQWTPKDSVVYRIAFKRNQQLPCPEETPRCG